MSNSFIVFTGQFLAQKFLGEGIDGLKDKVITKKIFTDIKTFISSFDNTSIDTNAFQSFLYQQGTQELIFSYIFPSSSNKVKKLDKNTFINNLSENAFEHINSMYREQNRKELDNVNEIKEYFKSLLESLIEQRDKLLNLKDKALVATLQEFLIEFKSELKLDLLNEFVEVLNKEDKRSLQDQSIFDQSFYFWIDKIILAYERLDNKRVQEIVAFVDSEIIKEIKIEIENKEKQDLSDFDEKAYKGFYNGCLNAEEQYLHLGLEEIYPLFKMIINLLMESQGSFTDTKLQQYYHLFRHKIDNDVLKLIKYWFIYMDEKEIIEFFDKLELITDISTLSPIDLSKGRSFWGYIVKNSGNLDPYSTKNIL